jgi:hypothetical protein
MASDLAGIAHIYRGSLLRSNQRYAVTRMVRTRHFFPSYEHIISHPVTTLQQSSAMLFQSRMTPFVAPEGYTMYRIVKALQND